MQKMVKYCIKKNIFFPVQYFAALSLYDSERLELS